MNIPMKRTKLTVILLALAVSVPIVPSVAVAEEHESAPVMVPDSVPEIWKSVQAHEAELGKAIVDKKLDGVHEIAFAIRDLVNALPGKSKLAPDRLAKLKSNAKFVAALASRLDESGDAKDQATTEANFQKLQNVLKTIEALYPPDQLKDDMAGMKM